MSLLHQLAQQAKDLPAELQSLTLEQIVAFSDICAEYAEDFDEETLDQGSFIVEAHAATGLSSAPAPLPEVMAQSLAVSAGLSIPAVQMLWSTTCVLVDRKSGEDRHAANLTPPTTTCLRSQCSNKKLVNEVTYDGTLFTLRRGALPLKIQSAYCKSCNTRYHPDFHVSNPSQADAKRVYYTGIPKFIGVAEHAYVEPELCVLMENMYLFSHASSEAIARIYNRSLTDDTSSQPLKGPIVLEAFMLHALLRFHTSHDRLFTVPHHGPQRQRLDDALVWRNAFMAGRGQPQWAHACMVCQQIKSNDAGRKYRQSACVVDGISITHACCGYKSPAGAPCRTPLSRTQDRFCHLHQAEMDVCGIRGCTNACDPGFKSCADPLHRQAEVDRRQRGKSMNILKERAAAAAEYSKTGVRSKKTTRKRATGRQQKTTFQRSWTHNEELAVRPCGVIISRATFFQSEATSAVKASLTFVPRYSLTDMQDFIMNTFPVDEYPGCKPSFIFYDDNCCLWKFLAALDENSPIRKFFEDIGLAVDVFHFRSKHKEGDMVCQTHCNPANFPDLVNENGSWVYNSSAAEQANRWIKKFKNIVREMDTLTFNFFLDEMIMLRNEFIVQGLEKAGKLPHIIPEESLLHVERAI